MSKKIHCIDCGEKFKYTEKERRFYDYMGYDDPIRCKKCRQAMRQIRRSPYFSIGYFGVESVFYDFKGLKHRRNDVNKPAFVVGGFR